MHLNWLMPLGGVLGGTLPNPDFSSSAYIAQRVFGARPARPNDIVAGSGITATLSGGTVTLTATAGNPDDSQAILAGQDYGKHIPLTQPYMNTLAFSAAHG